MSELGQYLKEVREEKRITLDDIQQSTKIQKRYLQAIEEGRYDTLPGLFYARAFVKTYAEAIGLDPEPLFDQFEHELPNPRENTVDLPSRSERAKTLSVPKQRRRRNPILPIIFTVIVIGIVVYSFWLFAQSQGSGEAGDDPISPTDSEKIEAEFSEDEHSADETAQIDSDEGIHVEEDEDEEENEPEQSEPLALTFVKSEGNTSYFELSHGRLTDVSIELSGTSHVDVKNGQGHTFYTGMPGSGETLTFDELENEEEVIFNFGASQNVTLFIQDENVSFPLDVIHQKIAITVLE